MLDPIGGGFLFVVFLCILYLLNKQVGSKGMLWGLAGMGVFAGLYMLAAAREFFWVAFPIFVLSVLAMALAGSKIIGLKGKEA